jgi:hypothetical protein
LVKDCYKFPFYHERGQKQTVFTGFARPEAFLRALGMSFAPRVSVWLEL